MYAAAAYIAWLFVRSSTGSAFWFEGVAVLLLTYVGVKRCRERYSSATQDRFVEDCIILQVPIGLKFFVFFWLAHVATSYFLIWALPMLQPETYEEVSRVNALVKIIYNMYPFFYAFLGTALFYIRLGHHIETAARAQHL